MPVQLPQAAVALDHQLEAQTDTTSVQLMQHRWHWTLDETNPERVSLRGYASAVGRGHTMIEDYAKGYVVWTDRRGAASPDECRRRVHMGVQTGAATEAVAKGRGVGFAYAQHEFFAEVRRVRDIARQHAEDKGTSTLEEIPAVAEFMYRALEADTERDAVRSGKHTLRYIEIESKLDKARRQLLDAARIAEDVDLAADERQLLSDTLGSLKRLLALMDRAIADETDRSWVEDLRVLQGGLAS